MADLVFAQTDDVLALLERHKERTKDGRWGPSLLQVDAPPAELPVATTTLIPRRSSPVEMVISGGQTGADRAGLDAALAVGLPIGGHVPKGRKTEAGPLDARYGGMTETQSADYGERTALNVKHSVATLVVYPYDEEPSGGTAKTIKLCKQHDRPCLPVPMHPALPASDRMVAQVVGWLRRRNVRVLNIAGPRASKCPDIYAAAYAFLVRVLGQEADVVETTSSEESEP